MSSDAMEVDPTDESPSGGPANNATAAGVSATAAPSRSMAAAGGGGGLHDAAADASVPSSTNTAAATGTAKEAAAPSLAAPTGEASAPQPQAQTQAQPQAQPQKPPRRLSSDLRHAASDAAMQALQAVLGGGNSSGAGGSGVSGAGDDGSRNKVQTNLQTAEKEAGAAAAAAPSSGAEDAPVPASRSSSSGAGTCAGSSVSTLRPATSPYTPTSLSSTLSSSRRIAESALNLTLVDPDRYGWTAAGGIADLATPHQVRRVASWLVVVACGCCVCAALRRICCVNVLMLACWRVVAMYLSCFYWGTMELIRIEL